LLRLREKKSSEEVVALFAWLVTSMKIWPLSGLRDASEDAGRSRMRDRRDS
jgi:hypothetical protein